MPRAGPFGFCDGLSFQCLQGFILSASCLLNLYGLFYPPNHGPTQYPLRKERSEAHRCDPLNEGASWMELSLYPILHPGSNHVARHKATLLGLGKSKGSEDNAGEAEHHGCCCCCCFPSHTAEGLTQMDLYDIKPMLRDQGLTLTNLLILPRCQTHFQAIALSQLVKVSDNLHALS